MLRVSREGNIFEAIQSQNVDQQFNFENVTTKLNYAKAKFLLGLGVTIVYLPIAAFVMAP